jgi:2-methylcitrate dehydratase PrpD
MLDRPNVTQRLARFIADTRPGDIPVEVMHQAKRSVMNYFAVALAGCRTAPVEIALATLKEFSGGKQATIVGRRERIDALSAAFLNAASANVYDFCDTHTRTVIHPTAPVVPPLLALSEMRSVSGAELLFAIVIGSEVQARIGLAVSPQHYANGWHITSTCGVFGAASAVGKIIGLDQQKLGWALGAAATQSSGLCECLGTATKSASVGNAARNGLLSALLAEKGFDGPPEPLAGVQAFYNAMGVPPDYRFLTEGYGETWELMETSYKPYPCGFVINPVLDCVLDFRRDNPKVEVTRVVVHGNSLLAQRTDRPDVTSGRLSQVSVQHAVAVALLFGKAGVEEFSDEAVADPKVAALRSRVEVVRDDSFETIAAAVEITTVDGKVQKLSTRAARGSEINPLSDSDLEIKLRNVAAAWDKHYDVRPLIDAIWALDKSADVSGLSGLAIPRG